MLPVTSKNTAIPSEFGFAALSRLSRTRTPCGLSIWWTLASTSPMFTDAV